MATIVVGVGIAVERYPQVDFDLPSCHSHLLDNEPHELLPTVEVEAVDGCVHAAGKVADLVAEAIVLGQFVALRDESIALFCEHAEPGVELAGATVDLGQLQQPGLIQIGQPSAFGGGVVALAL